jgi:hypothetical protein
VAYIGDRVWPDFAEPVQWLSKRARISFVPHIEAAVLMISGEQNPFDLLIVAERRPAEHTHRALDSLRSAAPLTPIVCLLGDYCQGQTRTGKPWPGAVRVYAHQFAARLGRRFERWEVQAETDWAPPFTTTEEDRLLGPSHAGEQSLRARVAVFADLRETASALGDLLRTAGCSVVYGDEGLLGVEVDVTVWDCQADFAASKASFERLIERWPQIAKVVLLGFPRVADQVAAMACGAAAVLSKPFLIDDLLWQIKQLASITVDAD